MYHPVLHQSLPGHTTIIYTHPMYTNSHTPHPPNKYNFQVQTLSHPIHSFIYHFWHATLRVHSDSQSLINTLSGGPARQSDLVCNSIWSHLSTMSKNFNIFVQWIPSHIGLPGNTLADSEAKRGSTLSESSVPIDLASAKAQIRRTGQQEFHTRYLADPHSASE